jgi:hypothetical protein
VYQNSGLSYYDVRTSDSIPSTYIKFLNSASTRSAIGATQSYSECSNSAVSLRKKVSCIHSHIALFSKKGGKFGSTADSARNFAPRVADLLNNGVRVLLYAGK